ncbi:hypothetical protein Hypma_003973 [Hypsizygus marmoreus]|uniref:Uncharacterized protein n=1 Tax=Hypsizygus marmoreus TaxID=39966 RepID=A0A369J7K2_HYPMA|nr:hypothetical protein Hypma_003973 [Hypsizygus marmoreus]
MFFKLSLLALVAPLVAGLTVNIPRNPVTSGPVTITWSYNPSTDPSTFSIELINEVFHNAFAIANNVDATQEQIDLVLPVVPVGPGYTVQFVNPGNIGDVFAETGTFTIGENTSSTASSTSSSASSSSSSSASRSTSGSTSRTSSVSLGITTTLSQTSTSGFGVTVTSPTQTPTSTSTNTGTSGNPTPTTFNNAAFPLKVNMNVGAAAAVLLSAVAGAAVFAL